MSTFSGLDIARKALSTAQKGIDVTGHNIANAQTPGYSRQRLTLASIEPSGLGTRFAPAQEGRIGEGVRIVTVDQIRNPFLDRQYRHEYALEQEYQMRSEDLLYVESLFDELSETGLTNGMNEFLSSLQELTKSPTSKEYRTNVLQNAIKLGETFAHYARQIADKQAEQDRTVTVMTGQINDIAQTVGELNTQIARYELSGQTANDLRDKRNLLLDELSGLVAFTAEETADGRLQVSVGSELLVDHNIVRRLDTVAAIDNPITGEPASLQQVVWQDTGDPLAPESGRIKAVLDLRDGSSAEEYGLPYIDRQIDRLAGALAVSFNEVHRAGWTLPGDSGPSQTGVDFFLIPVDGVGNPLPVTAENLTVNPDIINDVNRIAASGQEVLSEAQAGDNTNSLDLLTLFDSHDIPDVGHYADFLESFIAELAVETAHNEKRVSGQSLLVQSLDTQRQSVSGVSLDEEMSRMVQLQHSYSAAARLMTTIDQNLDVLINRTGIVGR